MLPALRTPSSRWRVAWTQWFDRVQGAADAIGNARALWAPIAFVYVMVIFFAVARFHPSTVQEMVRRQGVTTIVTGTVVSAYRSLALVLFIGGLGVLFITRRPVLRYALGGALLIWALALVPWSALVALVVLLLLAGLLLALRIPAGAVSIVLFTGLLAIPVGAALLSPWLPLEYIALIEPAGSGEVEGDGVARSGRMGPHRCEPASLQRTDCGVKGYVLGEQAGQLSVIREDDRLVQWVPLDLVASRSLCEPASTIWKLDSRSVVELFRDKYPCERGAARSTPGDGDPPGDGNDDPPDPPTTTSVQPPPTSPTTGPPAPEDFGRDQPPGGGEGGSVPRTG